MKFTADRAELAGKLNQVAPAVARDSTLPMLEHVLLQAEGEIVTLRASNLETGIRVSLPAVVEEEGACTAPFRALSDWVSAPLPKDQITLTLTSVNDAPVSLRVQCGRNYCTLKGLFPEEEAPVFPVADGVAATTNAEALTSAIEGVSWAAMPEKNATMIACTGIMMEIREDGLRLVAMDGSNLAVHDCSLLGGFSSMAPVIVNKPSMLAAASILSGEVEISVGEGHVGFRTDDVTLVATALMGEYPDYVAVSAGAEGADNVWTMEKKEAAGLVKTVAPFAVHQYGGPVFVRVSLSADTKAVTVSGISPDVGNCVGSIEAEGEQDIQFAVNPTYMKRAIDSIEAEQVMFVLSGPKLPLLLRAVGSEQHWIMMMPVSVKEAEDAE